MNNKKQAWQKWGYGGKHNKILFAKATAACQVTPLPRQNKGDSDFLRMKACSRFSQTDIQGNECMTACQFSAAAASHHLSVSWSSLDW